MVGVRRIRGASLALGLVAVTKALGVQPAPAAAA